MKASEAFDRYRQFLTGKLYVSENPYDSFVVSIPILGTTEDHTMSWKFFIN